MFPLQILKTSQNNDLKLSNVSLVQSLMSTPQLGVAAKDANLNIQDQTAPLQSRKALLSHYL